MAKDAKGVEVGLGDWCIASGLVVRIVSLNETLKGTTAKGAYVDMVGYGRIAKARIDLASATLIMRADGSVV